MDDDVIELGLVEASARVAAGEIDPVRLTEAYLRRIEETEPILNAYVTVDAEGALVAAERARDEIADGRHRGPLHGIPIGVKDIFDTAGLRTTYGSGRFRDHIPARDAAAVAALREAGAVILGKHATHEFAWGGRTDGRHFGPTRNPNDPMKIPGGSSGGGGASITAGSSLLALGSDTAGSVRIPAALCGCVGVKPARNWLAMTGAFPLAPSLDHAGVLARSTADAALAIQALTGRRPGREDGRPLRIAVVGGDSAVLDSDVATALIDARERLEERGAVTHDIDFPDIAARAEAILTLVALEARRIHQDAFAADPAQYGDDLAELLSAPPPDSAALDRARVVVTAAVAALRVMLRRADAVMTATVPILAPAIGRRVVQLGGESHPIEPVLTRLTSIANVAGLPAVSVPAPDVRPLPVGVQFIAEDLTTAFAAGRLLE